MDKFIEDAFRQAMKENDDLETEAEVAVAAFKKNAIPTWLAAGELLDNLDGLARAVVISGTKDDLFELMKLFFYSGFREGAEHGRSI